MKITKFKPFLGPVVALALILLFQYLWYSLKVAEEKLTECELHNEFVEQYLYHTTDENAYLRYWIRNHCDSVPTLDDTIIELLEEYEQHKQTEPEWPVPEDTRHDTTEFKLL